MADLVGQIGEVTMTVQVTRAETGKVEEYELIGKVMADESQDEAEAKKGDN